MAVNPKKLAALVNPPKKKLDAEGDEDEEGDGADEPDAYDEAEGGDEGDDEDATDEEDEGSHEEPDDDEDAEGGEPDPLAAMGTFADELRAAAAELEVISDSMPDGVADDEPDEEAETAAKGSVGKLPKGMRGGIRKFVKPLDREQVMAVAEKLADEGKVTDAAKFGGWLVIAAQAA